MYIIKHPRWKFLWHITQIKKRYVPNTKEIFEEPMSVIYDMFEVPRPSPIQQNRTSKRKHPDGNYGNKSQKTKIWCPMDIFKNLGGGRDVV